MIRMLLIGALSFGTVAGFASGFAHMGHCARGHHEARRAAFEAHVADLCVQAAERSQGDAAPHDRRDHGPAHFAE